MIYAGRTLPSTRCVNGYLGWGSSNLCRAYVDRSQTLILGFWAIFKHLNLHNPLLFSTSISPDDPFENWNPNPISVLCELQKCVFGYFWRKKKVVVLLGKLQAFWIWDFHLLSILQVVKVQKLMNLLLHLVSFRFMSLFVPYYLSSWVWATPDLMRILFRYFLVHGVIKMLLWSFFPFMHEL